ncbi:MAG: hypothetical protein ACREHD_04585 [Pirellulales bacterium]
MTTKEESKLSEAEFLESQAAEAQAAMQETWDELKTTLKETASIDVWAKRHPWVVTGAAVAGGFLLATLLFSPHAEAEPTAEEEPAQPASGGRRRLGWLMEPLFGLLRPVFGQLVSSLIAAALGALTGAMAAAPDGQPTAGNADGNGAMPSEGPVPL